MFFKSGFQQSPDRTAFGPAVHAHLDIFQYRHRFEQPDILKGSRDTLGNNTVIDQDYKHDPEFAGDLSESDNWLYGRVNDAYININFKDERRKNEVMDTVADIKKAESKLGWKPIIDIDEGLSLMLNK